MKIGIVIAVVRELKSFLESDYEVRIEKVNNKDVYLTTINNNLVYAIQSGMGKIDAASATQLLITKYDCDIIINYGVTGALDKSLKVDDLFVVEKTCNYDLDTTDIDPVKKYQYADQKDEYIYLDKDLIKKVKALDNKLVNATVASGDKFISDKKEKERLNTEIKCNICDMEIAGIARVCALCNVPCMSIKCISDTFDGSGLDFEKNVTSSANKAFQILKKFLNTL